MILLLIESSTERGIVSIVDSEKILFFRALPFGYSNSKYLVPTLSESLKETKLEMSQIGLIAVGVGPGSYTGIRVGATVAKTLSYAAKKPLVGISTLEAFIPSKEGNFAVVIDAKISGVYLLIGERQNNQIKYLSQPMVRSIEQAQKLLEEVPVVVTPNSERLRTLFPGGNWEWQESAPDPQAMAKAALKKFDAGQFSLSGELELMYLRKTQAEIEREAKRSPKTESETETNTETETESI